MAGQSRHFIGQNKCPLSLFFNGLLPKKAATQNGRIRENFALDRKLVFLLKYNFLTGLYRTLVGR